MSLTSLDVTGVTDAVAGDGDACSVWVSLLWTDFADNVAVADFCERISRNVGKVDNVKGVGAINWLCGGICASEALAETTKLFGLGGAPDLLVLWMFDKLVVFKGLSSVVIQNGCGNEGIGGCDGTCGLSNISKHDNVGVGFGVPGCHKSMGTSAEGDGFTKTWGGRNGLGWRLWCHGGRR